MTVEQYDRMTPKVVAVCMAYDAFRLCLGGQPKTFTREQVLHWLDLVGE